jgi:type IV secretion system protein TrbJ
VIRKHQFTIAAVVAIALWTGVAPAPAQVGFIANLATETTQLLNNAQLIAQYIRLGEQLRQQILMYGDMLRNSRVLSSQAFGSIMADLNQLAAVVQGGRALAYSMANLDNEFRMRFRGYRYEAGGYYRDYRDWSQTTLDTTLGTLRAVGLQGQQLQSEQAVLARLRAMAISTEGRLQAIQVANQIADQSIEQLMKLRQLMIVDLQSKQAYQAAQIQKEMQSHAATERFFNYVPPPKDGRTFEAGWR